MNHAAQHTALELIQKALSAPSDALARDIVQGLRKSATQATGLVAYDLEPGARTLIYAPTSLRNRIARVGGGKGTMSNWKMVTSANSPRVGAGVSEGKRGGVINTTAVDKSAAYKGIGLENNFTFEAGYAADGQIDLESFESLSLLTQVFLSEEHIILGGNNSLALGTTPTPTVSTATTGGSIGASTALSVICVALTFAGWQRATLAAVPQDITRTNADGTSDTYGGGSARKSSNGTVTTGAGTSTNTVSASVTAVAGAYAYAWFFGAAGSERCAAITNINSVKFTSVPGSGQLASALDGNDHSTNALVFDGLLTYAAQGSGIGSYYVAQATGTPGTGTPLTSNGMGGIAEFDTDLLAMWSSYKVTPDRINVSAQEQVNITNKVASNGGTPILGYPVQGGDGITAGVVVARITHPVTRKLIPVEVHPDLPPGTILYEADSVPYQGAVGNVKDIRTRREYHRIDWPLRSRQQEWGVYVDEVLRVFWPQTLGMRTNVANG